MMTNRLVPVAGIALLAAAWLPACDDGGDPAPAQPYACVMDPACTRVMVASHRGFHLALPENSLAAMRAAAAVGVDFVEIDVRHTADGVLVLMHDADVDRTTDGRGEVAAMTGAQVQALTLKGAPDGATDADTLRVPTFQAALALARELGIALYVDQKTDRTDLVLDAIRAGRYHDVAMIRDGLDTVAAMVAVEPRLWVMPFIDDEAGLQEALARIPGLRIAEVAGQGEADATLIAAMRAAGVKAQQDVMLVDWVGASTGDYTFWKGFIDVGLALPQTDYPHLLVPAVAQFNQTGVFPATGPAHE
jgi:glycerophosphoryl diester phosphodiesterase